MRAPVGLLCWIAVLGGLLLAGSSPAGATDEVRFVVLGDSQLVRPEQFERLVHEVNLLAPDFVACTGDMIHGYTDDVERLREEWRRYRRQIEPLTMPFFPMPGNHDVGTPRAHDIYAETWGPDRFYYTHDHGPVRCIVLDSYHAGVRDRLLPDQRAWLREQLDDFARAHGGLGSPELANRSIFIFVHSPFWRYDPAREEGHADWLAVEEFLSDYPVRMVIAGNTDRHHETMWERRRGIDHVVLTSTGAFPQDNERAGYFHGFLHVRVAGGDVRAAVVRPGSVLPLDTVSPADREVAARHGLRDGVLRIAEWTAGEPLNLEVAAAVENTLAEPRTLHLRWAIPRDSGVAVRPAELWLDLAAGEIARPRFVLSAESAPARDLMPTLHVSATSILRSGVVSRDWEARYRDEIARSLAGEEVPTTSIALDAEFRFEARHTLFVPPELRVARRRGAVEIDGRIDEEAWGAAAVLDGFRQSGGEEAAPIRTEVRALYDDEHLFLSAWMHEPNPAQLKADAAGEIPLTWNDDDIEFFFDPAQTGLDHTRIFENPAGTRFNGKPIGTPDRYARMAYESAIHVGPDHWSIEMRIPWSDIVGAAAPSPGESWGFNVWRHRPQSSPARFYWSVDAYHQGRYGVLTFD
ncbi:MAG: metallophosphoesterase [Candidatus Sumerlaeia bacterium]|nr:metallophosphoesterase [Candidatus Sumerlaeia bacterium]